MITSLSSLIAALKSVTTPEELFGVTTAKAEYRKLAKLTHPDSQEAKSSGCSDEDLKSFSQQLNDLWSIAEERIAKGIYGTKEPLPVAQKGLSGMVIVGRKSSYTLLEERGQNTIAKFCSGVSITGDKVFVKITTSPADMDLFENEAAMLKTMRTSEKTKTLPTLALLPNPIEHFIVGAKAQRKGVMVTPGADDNTMSLTELMKHFPNGLPLRHVIWIINRATAALEAAHILGIVYGAMVPDNVIINPETHGGYLCNWDFSTYASGKIKGLLGPKDFYPPEVFAKLPVNTGVDLYMLSKLFMFLLSGSASTPCNEFLPSWKPVDALNTAEPGYRELMGLLRACQLPAHMRIKDYSEFFSSIKAIAFKIFGKPTFAKLTIPNVC